MASGVRPEEAPIAVAINYTECYKLIRALRCRTHGRFFLRPVDVRELRLPDYLQIVTRPMDLQTIAQLMDDDHYATVADFLIDLDRIWENATLYNPPMHPVNEAALAMRALVQERCQKELLPNLVRAVGSDSTEHCVMCMGDVSLPCNLIVYCERCTRGFHQRCVGLKEVPAGDYMCQTCVPDRTQLPDAGKHDDLAVREEADDTDQGAGSVGASSSCDGLDQEPSPPRASPLAGFFALGAACRVWTDRAAITDLCARQSVWMGSDGGESTPALRFTDIMELGSIASSLRGTRLDPLDIAQPDLPMPDPATMSSLTTTQIEALRRMVRERTQTLMQEWREASKQASMDPSGLHSTRVKEINRHLIACRNVANVCVDAAEAAEAAEASQAAGPPSGSDELHPDRSAPVPSSPTPATTTGATPVPATAVVVDCVTPSAAPSTQDIKHMDLVTTLSLPSASSPADSPTTAQQTAAQACVGQSDPQPLTTRTSATSSNPAASPSFVSLAFTPLASYSEVRILPPKDSDPPAKRRRAIGVPVPKDWGPAGDK